jgi:hypothetical protein
MTQENRAKDQAATQLSRIREMLAALECNYDRLEELREEAESAEVTFTAEDADELAELEAAANGCESEEEARERIQEDPLSVQVRSGWHNPGEESSPEEFEILLCTGGPAVRIMGDLDEYNQPCRAYIQYRDWGTPWTDYYEDGMGAACLAYAQQFYFGE